MNNCSSEDVELIQILWDFMKLNDRLEKSDCIIVLGCADINVAKVAINIYKSGLSDRIIFSGGLRKYYKKYMEYTRSKQFC